MIRIHPARILRALLIVATVMVGGFVTFTFVHVPFRPLTRLVDLAAEASVPAWYVGLLLSTAAGLALARGLVLRRGAPGSEWPLHVLAALGLLVLSADEVGQLHASVSGGLRGRLAPAGSAWDDPRVWHAIASMLYVSVAGVVLLALPRQAAALLGRSPGARSLRAGFVLLAVGLLSTGQFEALLPGQLGAGIDETLEMLGATFLLYGFLVNLGTVRLQQGVAPPSADTAADGVPVVPVRPGLIFAVCAAASLGLIGGFVLFRHVHMPLEAVTRVFAVWAEGSVPAWYAGTLLSTIGLTAILTALARRGRADPSSPWRLYLVMGAGFLFLSADEVGQIHETISGSFHKSAAAVSAGSGDGGGATAGEDSGAWDLLTFGLYLAVAAAALLTFRRGAVDLFVRSPGRWSILAGAIVYGAGAVVIDQVQHVVPWGLGAAVEDGCELFGAALLLHGFLVNLGTVTVATATAAAARVPARPAKTADDRSLAGARGPGVATAATAARSDHEHVPASSKA